jgi:hypothetical protein
MPRIFILNNNHYNHGHNPNFKRSHPKTKTNLNPNSRNRFLIPVWPHNNVNCLFRTPNLHLRHSKEQNKSNHNLNNSILNNSILTTIPPSPLVNRHPWWTNNRNNNSNSEHGSKQKNTQISFPKKSLKLKKVEVAIPFLLKFFTNRLLTKSPETIPEIYASNNFSPKP